MPDPYKACTPRASLLPVAFAGLFLAGCASWRADPRPLGSPATDPVAFEAPVCAPDTTVYATLEELRTVDSEASWLHLPGGPRAFGSAVDVPLHVVNAGVEGRVDVTFTVDVRGRAASPEVLASPHPDLARAVLRRLHEVRFEPATSGGTARCGRSEVAYFIRRR